MLKNANILYCSFGDRVKSSLIDCFIVSTIASFITIPIIYILYANSLSVVLDKLTEISIYSVGLNKIFVSDILQVYQDFLLEKVANRSLSLQSETLVITKRILLWGYIYNILFVITVSAYMTCMLCMKRKSTYGLGVFEAIVVNHNMERLSFLHSFCRSIVTILVGIFTFGIGFLTILFRDDKRGLNDMISKTYVIYSIPNKPKLQVDDIQISNKKNDHKHNIEYARFWIRFPAYLIDSLLVFIASILLALLFEEIFSKSFDPFTLFSYIIFSAIYTITQVSSKHQATYGMRLFNIIIVDLDMNRLSLLQSVIRYEVILVIAKFTYMLGFVIIAFREDKRGLHDIIARTYVIYK